MISYIPNECTALSKVCHHLGVRKVDPRGWCGVGEDEQLLLSPREGSASRKDPELFSAGLRWWCDSPGTRRHLLDSEFVSLPLPAGSDGVGHLRSQGATMPLNVCSGMRYKRNGRASGEAENSKPWCYSLTICQCDIFWLYWHIYTLC